MVSGEWEEAVLLESLHVPKLVQDVNTRNASEWSVLCSARFESVT